MGVPSQAQIHNLTDMMAAMIQKDLDGFASEVGAKTNSTLGDYVDGFGDLELEAALLAEALSMDSASLPANYGTALGQILDRTAGRALASKISATVVSEGYATLRAYLADKSAVVSPLFAELARTSLGESCFDNSGDITEVFSPAYVARVPDRVYTGADGALTDDTTDATSTATADVALFTSDDHCLYVGSRLKFTTLVVGLSTLSSANIAGTFQYWNGNAWTTLTKTDNSVGLTKNLSITWTAPSDWERSYKDGGGTAFADASRFYYIRIQRTENTVVTPPVATMIHIVPEAILNASAAHLGVTQGPLGILSLTGVDTIAAAQALTVAYARFKEPAIRLKALTPVAANATITISYTNQAGANVTQAQSAWNTPIAVGDTKALTLNGADTGVRSIRTTAWAVTSTATEGVIAVEGVALRTPAI